MPNKKDPLAILAEYHERFARGDASCADLVAPRATFVGPVARANGKSEIEKLNAGFMPAIERVETLHRVAAGDIVASLLRFHLRAPTGPLVMEFAEFDVVRNGLIESFRGFYDPREFNKAFGME